MKKVLIVFVLVFSVFLASCSSAPALSFTSTLAWSKKNQKTEEYSKYQITRYFGDTNSIIISDNQYSFLEYTLKEGYSVKYNNNKIELIEDLDSTLLMTNLTLAYLDDESVPVLYRGSIENIVSYAVFNRYDLKARFTYKKANVAQKVSDNLSHEMIVDYDGSFTGTRQAKFIANEQETILSIKDTNCFDSESIYYVVRSLESLALGSTMTLDVALPYQDFADSNKTVKVKSFKQTTSADVENIEVSQEIYNVFNETGGDLLIPCYKTTLSLNQKKKGPDTILHYAVNKTRQTSFGASSYEASNVLIKFQYPTYEKIGSSLTLAYTQVYQLVEYNNYSR